MTTEGREAGPSGDQGAQGRGQPCGGAALPSIEPGDGEPPTAQLGSAGESQRPGSSERPVQGAATTCCCNNGVWA